MRPYCRAKMIKVAGSFFLFLMSLQVSGQPSFKINQYNIAYDGDFMPVLTLYTNYAFNPKIGFSSYFYVNGYKKNSWGEGLAGPNWTPAKVYFKTGTGIGHVLRFMSPGSFV